MKTRMMIFMAALMLTLLTVLPASAQKKNDQKMEQWRERVQAERIAYITSKVELTPAEAEKFWPVYNEISARREAAMQAERKAFRELKKAVKENDEAKISEALKTYTQTMDNQEKTLGKDVQALRKVLPETKVAKVLLAEEQFRHEQIGKLHKGKNGPAERNGKGRGKGKAQRDGQDGQGKEDRTQK